jgi:hypothetical protein
MWFKGEGEKSEETLFTHLVFVLDNLIKSSVLVNLLLHYEKCKELSVGDLTIKPEGLYKKRFWRSPQFLPWSGLFNAVLRQGFLVVLKRDPKKGHKDFFACSLSVMNAILLPELCTFLFQENGSIDTQTKKDLEERKQSELAASRSFDSSHGQHTEIYCWSCSGLIEAGQKYCTQCGSKQM